jgi:hypothetical protein
MGAHFDPLKALGIALQQRRAVVGSADAELSLDLESGTIPPAQEHGWRAADDQILVLADVYPCAQERGTLVLSS